MKALLKLIFWVGLVVWGAGVLVANGWIELPPMGELETSVLQFLGGLIAACWAGFRLLDRIMRRSFGI